MKRLLLVFSVMSLRIAFSQDELHLKDNTILKVKIIGYDSVQVRYTSLNNPDGPVYIEYPERIKLIVFENGSFKDYLSVPTPLPELSKIKPASNDQLYKTTFYLDVPDSQLCARKNVVFLNAASVLNSVIAVSYWRELFKNRLVLHTGFGAGLSVPMFYNTSMLDYQDAGDFQATRLVYDLSAGIYFNTFGRGKFAHVIGPSVRTSQYNASFMTYYYFYEPDLYGTVQLRSIPTKNASVFNESFVYLFNGFLFRISPHFNIMASAAIGWRSERYFLANHPYNFHIKEFIPESMDRARPAVQLGINFGYRF